MNCPINPKIIDYRNYYSGVAIGYNALLNHCLGNNNVAIGYNALYVKAPAPASPS
jgi:hypothetical protein